MENKNVFIAIALSMSVLLFWSAFVDSPQPVQKQNEKILNSQSENKIIDLSLKKYAATHVWHKILFLCQDEIITSFIGCPSTRSTFMCLRQTVRIRLC